MEKDKTCGECEHYLNCLVPRFEHRKECPARSSERRLREGNEELHSALYFSDAIVKACAAGGKCNREYCQKLSNGNSKLLDTPQEGS